MQILGRQYVLHYNKNTIEQVLFGKEDTKALWQKETFLSKVISYIDYISIKNNLVNSVCSSLKEIYDVKLNLNEIEFIHNSLNSNSITGSSKFIQTIKNTTGICFFEKKRKTKNKQIKGDKMYKKIELLSKEKHSNLK